MTAIITVGKSSNKYNVKIIRTYAITLLPCRSKYENGGYFEIFHRHVKLVHEKVFVIIKEELPQPELILQVHERT